MAVIRITYDGEPALTTAQAAQRYGMTAAGMRAVLSRLGLQPLDESVDGRTPLYLEAELDRAMAARPGQGRGSRPSRRGRVDRTAGPDQG